MTTVPEYVDRHIQLRDGIGKLIVITYAINSNSLGRSWMTQAEIAERVSRTLRTVKWHMARLLRPAEGPAPLLREGRTYVIVGYAEHEPGYCPHGDCIREALGDELAVRRRANAARRAREYRERLAGRGAQTG